MWSQSTRLVREGALGPLSFAMKDSIQSNQRTFKQNSYWLIGVSYNIIGKQGMIVGIIRIILSGIIFRDNRIRRQIQKQPSILSDDPRDHFIQLIIGYDLPDNKESSDMEASAADAPVFF